jgi:hypothetical protein
MGTDPVCCSAQTSPRRLLDLRPDGGFTFTPDPFFVGAYTFLYKVRRDQQFGSSGLVTINVAPPAGVPAPLAVSDHYHVGANGTLNVEAPGVQENDDPRSAFPTTLELLTSPLHGTLQHPGGAFTYSPSTGFSGYELRVHSPFVATVPVPGRAIGATLVPGSYIFSVGATTRCKSGVHGASQTVVVP